MVRVGWGICMSEMGQNITLNHQNSTKYIMGCKLWREDWSMMQGWG